MTSSSIALDRLVPQDERPLVGSEFNNRASSSSTSLEEDRDATFNQVTAYEDSQKVQDDPFSPFNDLPKEGNHSILTLRALTVGIACGTLVNGSNIYLGLKAGWTTSANIFGSIVGFAILKSASKKYPDNIFLGASFGPQENNIVQTTATAAGGMANVFISAFPAMYQLGLMTTPTRDFFKIVTLTAAGGYFGLFFATPLRRFFIIDVARELNLVFPSSTATATTIRSMHLAAGGTAGAKRKMRALGIAFVFAMLLRIVSTFAVGLLWDWHIFTWLAVMGVLRESAIYYESWGWFVEWTPAFIGSGMLVGVNVALSFLGGSVVAWGIIGPYLIKHSLAFGKPISEDPQWAGFTSYSSVSKEFANATHPSPRYWLLWPGVACMMAVSFTELLCQWRIFWLTAKQLNKAFTGMVSSIRNRSHRYQELSNLKDMDTDVDADTGPQNLTEKGEEYGALRLWMWFPGLVAVIILTCVVTKLQYGMPIFETLLALVLAFFFSFLAIQATGATDITPLTAASKGSQIILGATTRGPSWTLQDSQKLNLLGGALSSVGASQATDLTGDFRVGFLLGTPAHVQYAAQAIGTLVAVFQAPALFAMFAAAYPCILSTEEPPGTNQTSAGASSCPFTAPSVAAWRAVAVAATDPTFPVPRSSLIFSIIFAAFGSLMVLIRHFLWTGSWEKMRAYHPSMMVVAIAFIIPDTQYGTAMLIGAIIAIIWHGRSAQSYEAYGHAVAAGLMAGEGIGGVVNAALSVLGLGGETHRLTVGCPAGRC